MPLSLPNIAAAFGSRSISGSSKKSTPGSGVQEHSESSPRIDTEVAELQAAKDREVKENR